MPVQQKKKGPERVEKTTPKPGKYRCSWHKALTKNWHPEYIKKIGKMTIKQINKEHFQNKKDK